MTRSVLDRRVDDARGRRQERFDGEQLPAPKVHTLRWKLAKK